MSRRNLKLEDALRLFEELPSDDESNASDAGSQSSDEEVEDEGIPQRIADDISSSDEENDDVMEENQPSTSRGISVRWKRGRRPRDEIPEFTEESGPTLEVSDCDPIKIFLKIFTLSFMEQILFQTNLYATQKGSQFQHLQMHELIKFFAINLLMGIKRMPSYRDYWSSKEELHDSYVSKQMTVKRFSWILSNFHLNDNSVQPKRGEENFDKLYKVRPVLSHLSERFSSLFKPGRNQAIDESMIRFKGRSSIRQYMPNKPIKRGYKVWMRCDQTGFACQFEIYTGKKDSAPEKSLSERVVTSLCESLYGKNHIVYMDNFFTSYSLFRFLETRQVFACGTVNMSRKNLPRNLKDDKLLKRGDFDWAVSEEGIVCLKWKDRGARKKAVHILTSLPGPIEIKTVDRKEKDGSVLKIPCPQAVVQYNKNMGFVDHFDHLKSLYEIDRKSRKWWHRIFFHFLDVSLVNAYILYKTKTNSVGEHKSVKEFRLSVIKSLTTMAQEYAPLAEKKRHSFAIKGSKPHVPTDMRTAKVPHIPVKSTSRRCAFCSTKEKPHRTSTMCSACKVPLCAYQRGVTCFQKFHNM